MGIDHKLEGRKVKDKRTGKWKRQKGVPAPVKPTINVKGKATVVFNEQARNEWLTGFGKRKADRRKYGLAMQIIKDKRTKKDTLRQIRAIASNDNDDDDDANDIHDILNNNHTNNTNDNETDDRGSATLFDDDETQGMFGGAVTVVVDAGVSDEIDHMYKDNDDNDNDNDDDDDTRSISSYRSRGDGKTTRETRETKETSLQRAMKEVAKKNLLTKKKKFNAPNPFPKGKRHVDSDSSSSKSKKKRGGIRSTGKVLMNKALGGQKFKGSHKGRRPAKS